ncbi:MAG TPA: serine/threonine-protein kinase [Caulifigura sp.]|jgi:serine/threonine-protein kinase|nr:serine/threonine-protein kinase [Caulifigura sp.]
MSVLRNQPESEVSGTAYTFLKPMPSLRPSQSEIITPPPTSRPEVGGILFPAKDASPKPVVSGVALGPYVIEEEIGRGGMGAVFRAHDSRLDRVVALKVLGPDLSRDRSSVTRFQNEARAAARLDHESIARVHDVGHDHGLYYIAFEFVPGCNLREVLFQNGGRLSVDEAVGYTLQIADALTHTAAVDVVHRDIKPSNIILTPSGRAKLVDWGLARQNSLDLSQDLTQTGTTLGTFDYISPEQAVDPRNVDVRSDIYSLGCTLFHMLTGEPPYPRGSMFQKVVNHHSPEPPDASARSADVPPELSDVVRKMMAADPAARYATADELVADLISVATELGVRPASPTSGIWTTSDTRAPRDRVRAGWGWLGAFVALIVLVWSVDRSSRRAPLEPVEPSINVPLQTGNSTRVTPPAPAAPPETNRRSQPSGITQGTSETSRGLAKETPPTPLTSGATDLDLRSIVANLSSSVLESMKSLPQPDTTVQRPAAMNGRGFVLISASDEPSQSFSSLEAAVVAAADDDVIELDFDGLWDGVVRPIRTSRRLTIRAAPSRRPQLEIGLTRDEAATGIIASPKIFTLTGGSISIADVDLVLNVPGRNSARWSIFSLAQGARVSLRGVSITVQNRDQRPVSVFDAAGTGAKAIARAMTDAMAERPFEISLESCVVRGAADLILQDSADVMEVRIAQSALALNGALFRQTSGESADAMTSGRGPNELLLDHVTAVLERPLVLIELGDRVVTRPVQLDCRNSVLKFADATQAMIAVTGQGDASDYLDVISWNGRHNWLDLAGPAVEISTPGMSGPLVKSLRLDEWLSRWSARGASEAEQPATGLFARGEVWRQPEFSRIETEDFRLDDAGTNPALEGADDGGAAGVDLDQRSLPKDLPTSLRAQSSTRSPFRNRYAAEPANDHSDTPERR